jgi:hypothetical protein
VSSLNASDCSDVAFRIPSTPDDIEISEPRAIIDLTDTPNAESDPEAEYESIASPETSISTSSGPSSEEVRRQLEESERLAWELMQQDSLEAFNMQLEFIRQNSAGMDEADLQALTRAMEEERMAHEMMVRRAEAAARRAPLTVRDGAAAADDDEEEVGEGGSVEPDEQEEEDDSANWTYDQLLALGEAVGGNVMASLLDVLLMAVLLMSRCEYADVKTERWRLRSTNEIARLPKLVYDSSELVYLPVCVVFCKPLAHMYYFMNTLVLACSELRRGQALRSMHGRV